MYSLATDGVSSVYCVVKNSRLLEIMRAIKLIGKQADQNTEFTNFGKWVGIIF